MRIPRREHVGQLGVKFVDLRFEFGDLGGERLVVSHQLPGRLKVAAGGLELAVRRHYGRELREPTPNLARRRLIGVQFGVGQATLELGVLTEQRVDRRSAGVRTASLRHQVTSLDAPNTIFPERTPTPALRL